MQGTPEVNTETLTGISPESRWGFVLKRFVDLTNWKSQRIFDLDIERSETCPVCGEGLSLAASLASQSCGERIDIGHCVQCGLVSYIDRPTAAATERFYSEAWMGETPEDAAAVARDRCGKQKPLAYYQSLDCDRSRPVLEIGIGYGTTARMLKDIGFERVAGVEACPSRAAAVRDVHNIPVYLGRWEDMPAGEPYSLIMASHVLEHVHDPDAFVAKCAREQSLGDRLVLSVPNIANEPTVAVLLFWPHLHSFNRYALAYLLHKYGYEVERDETTFSEVVLSARKVSEPMLKSYRRPPLWVVVNKFVVGLGFEREEETMLTWQRDFDGASREPAWHAGIRTAGYEFPRRMMISPVREYLTDAPVEIQYEGRVEMCFK